MTDTIPLASGLQALEDLFLRLIKNVTAGEVEKQLETVCRLILKETGPSPVLVGKKAVEFLRHLPDRKDSTDPRLPLNGIRALLVGLIFTAWLEASDERDEAYFASAILTLPVPSFQAKGMFETVVREQLSRSGTQSIARLLGLATAESNKTVVIKAMQTIVGNMPSVELTLRMFREGFKEKYI